MTPSGIDHIVLDDRGRPWIDDTNTKVIEVVLDKLACNSSPEEMHDQYPHLSLAQIQAALSYYHDHKAEMDAELQRLDREYQEMRSGATRQATLREILERLEKIKAGGKIS